MEGPGKCGACGADWKTLDEGETEGIAYALRQCSNCRRYSLEVDREKLPADATFDVAAKEPFPDGKWVRLSKKP